MGKQNYAGVAVLPIIGWLPAVRRAGTWKNLYGRDGTYVIVQRRFRIVVSRGTVPNRKTDFCLSMFDGGLSVGPGLVLCIFPGFQHCCMTFNYITESVVKSRR